jgi:3-hydroxyacyl-CoA dehydrogenase
LPTLTDLGQTPLEQRVPEALRRRDEVGEFLREYLVPTLQYAEYLRTRIADDVRDIDRVIRWGFGWTQGPFELIETIGAANLGISQAKYYSGGQVLAGQSWTSPPPEPQFAPLSDYAVIEEGATVRRRDLGDGVQSLGITTKSGVLTPTAVAELTEILTRYPDQRFVLTSEGSSFSVGFDLTFFLERIESDALAEIDQALIALQSLGELLERSRVVAALRGYCLGGGLELALSCPILSADAEAKIGLPEAKVGLIPAGRGATLCRLHNQASKWLPEVAVSLAKGEVSLNADHARRLGYLRPQDVTSYHPDRLIWDAKNLARTVEPVSRPNWNPLVGPIAGKIEQGLGQAKRLGHLSDYDEKIGERIKHVMTKAPTYEAALARERHEFLDLCTKALTQARIRHMIQHKTPLRN